MKQPQKTTHNMTDELDFLKKIGTFGLSAHTPEYRVQCLKGYLRAIYPAKSWTTGEDTQLRVYAHKMLKEKS